MRRVGKHVTIFHLESIPFDLRIDGKPRPDRVFVGKGRQHPAANPFEISP